MSRTSGKAVERWSAQSVSRGFSPGSCGSLPSRKSRKLLAGDVDVLAVAVDEVHRHIERIVAVALVAEPVLEDEGQHAGAVGVGVFPDVAAEALVAVGLAFRERRVGEERGGDRLQREADAELLHHVGFDRIVEIYLDGAGAKHHVEAETADLRHVVEHDRVAALGHDRQLGARLVRPHAEPEEAESQPLADRLALVEMASRLGAGLVQVLQRRAAQLELARGLQADVPVRAAQRDDVAALDDRLPADIR